MSLRSATCKVQAQQTHRVSKTDYPNFKRNFKSIDARQMGLAVAVATLAARAHEATIGK